ncbi:MAG: DUF1059 domain-containing protein [Nocardioides sp.]
MVKRFRCGDVVPGCERRFTGTEDEILRLVAAHARDDHGLTVVGPELVSAVRAHLTVV